MIFSRLFRKPSPSDTARELRKAGVAKDRALIRATADRMRAEMGLPPARWPK